MELQLLCVREAKGEKINSADSIRLLTREEANADRECFWVLHLSIKNRITLKELISMGNINGTIVTPREVFRRAIIAGAASIITIHNHPSGELDPSPEDCTVWKILKEAGKLLGIEVLDNLIIGPPGDKIYSETLNFHKK